MKTGPKPRPLEERFWSHVIKEPDGCWMWTGYVDATNRAVYNFDSGGRNPTNKSALSMALMFTGREVKKRNPREKPVCKRRMCINPEHYPSTCFIDDKRTMEIVEKWKLNLLHRTTMEKLGREYGITKQRIFQILKDSEW